MVLSSLKTYGYQASQSVVDGFTKHRTHCIDGPILFKTAGKKKLVKNLVKGSVRPV